MYTDYIPHLESFPPAHSLPSVLHLYVNPPFIFPMTILHKIGKPFHTLSHSAIFIILYSIYNYLISNTTGHAIYEYLFLPTICSNIKVKFQALTKFIFYWEGIGK